MIMNGKNDRRMARDRIAPGNSTISRPMPILHSMESAPPLLEGKVAEAVGKKRKPTTDLGRCAKAISAFLLATKLAGCIWGIDLNTKSRDASIDRVVANETGTELDSGLPDSGLIDVDARTDSGFDDRDSDTSLDTLADSADSEFDTGVDGGVDSDRETDSGLPDSGLIDVDARTDSGFDDRDSDTSLDTLADSGFDTRDGVDSDRIEVDAEPLAPWRYCRDVSVRGTFPADYAHHIVFGSAVDHTHLRSDFTDVRALEGDCRTLSAMSSLLPIWIENVDAVNGSNFWVKTRTPGTTSIAVIYGNPAASPISDGSQVFEFFDGFAGTVLNRIRWTTTGRVSVTSGEVILTNDGIDSILRSNIAFGAGKTFEARVLFRGGDSMRGSDAYLGLHSNLTSSYTMFVYNGPMTWFPEQVSAGLRASGMISAIDNTHHIWTDRRDMSSSTYSVDYAPIVLDMSANSPTGPLYATIINQGHGVAIMADWVRIRGHVTPEPTNTLGAEISR